MLQRTLDYQLSSADVLDKKAWDILSVTSATLGIVQAILVSLKHGQLSAWFQVGLFAILVFYGIQIVEVWMVVRPRKWRIVPGLERGELHYEGLLEKYLSSEIEGAHYDLLIVDYAGKRDPEKPGKFVSGAIQTAIEFNNSKTRHLGWATALMGVVIILLVVMTFL